MMGLPLPVAVFPPGLEVAVKDVIGLPPSELGVKLTIALAFPPAAVPIVGATGSPVGVTGFDAADGSPVPAMLLAVTVKVYVLPLVSPVTVIGLAVDVAVFPSGLEVTV